MAILKLSMLKGACREQRALFKQHFGQGGEVTLEKALSVVNDFDWDWAAAHFLSPSAWVEYDQVSTSAWVEYDQVRASAQVEYSHAAWCENNRVRASAWFAGWEADHSKET